MKIARLKRDGGFANNFNQIFVMNRKNAKDA